MIVSFAILSKTKNIPVRRLQFSLIGRMPINLPIMIFSDLYGEKKICNTPAWQEY